MGQQTGTTTQVCDGWDTPYSIDLQDGTTQAFVYHSLTQPSSDQITAFISDREVMANQAATDAQKLSAANIIAQQASDIVFGAYPQFRIMLFQTLFTQAQLQGMPNRAAYIGQLVSWTEAIAVAAITAENQINACTTVDEVNAVTLGTIPADPQISLQVAMGITN